MYFDTTDTSTATDAVILPLLSRRVQIGFKSGSVATYTIRRRDQLKCLAMNVLTDDLSWGRFANWCQYQ
jgi:hypothetical protein